MRAIILLSLLVLVIASSGCVSQTQTGVGYDTGIKILNFEPEMDSVSSGESLNFQLRLKNMGSFEVSDAKAHMELGEWTCNSASESFRLVAPDPDAATEGEERAFSWKCTAPTIQQGMKIPYDARAEVEYKYKSISSQSLTVVPTSELISLKNAGRSLPSESESQSHSPVKLDIEVKGPIRLKDGGSAEFPVMIKISNIGGGIVKDSQIDLKVEGAGAIIKQGSDCDQRALALWKGQSQTITCQMSANRVDSMTVSRIVATAEYSYIISSSAKVEVTGTQ